MKRTIDEKQRIGALPLSKECVCFFSSSRSGKEFQV